MGLTSTKKQYDTTGPILLHWPQTLRLVDNEFYEFCRINKELRIERTSAGDCEIMASTGGETSWRNSRLITLLSVWADREGSGVVFDSSGGFLLSNGAIRSPDVSWIKKSRLAILTAEQKQRFLPLCPDFAIELLSPSYSLLALQAKMHEYIENGLSLGWLINPQARQVFIFQPGWPMFCADEPEFLSAENLLEGFELNMDEVWEAGF